MRRACLAAVFVVFLSAFAPASVVYSFSGTGVPVADPATFTLTVPTVIVSTGATGTNPDASFVPGTQLVCNACDHISFYVDAVAHGFTKIPSNTVGYGIPGQETFFYFAPNSFTVDGVYIDVIGGGFANQGTLTVSGVTPEPSSLILLGTGVLGLAGVVCRKLMR